jgi:hypothetical protein
MKRQTKNGDQDVKPMKVGESLGINSKEFWQMTVPATAEGFGDDPAGAFLPRPGKYRAQPHLKINECDH